MPAVLLTECAPKQSDCCIAKVNGETLDSAFRKAGPFESIDCAVALRFLSNTYETSQPGAGGRMNAQSATLLFKAAYRFWSGNLPAVKTYLERRFCEYRAQILRGYPEGKEILNLEVANDTRKLTDQELAHLTVILEELVRRTARQNAGDKPTKPYVACASSSPGPLGDLSNAWFNTDSGLNAPLGLLDTIPHFSPLRRR